MDIHLFLAERLYSSSSINGIFLQNAFKSSLALLTHTPPPPPLPHTSLHSITSQSPFLPLPFFPPRNQTKLRHPGPIPRLVPSQRSLRPRRLLQSHRPVLQRLRQRPRRRALRVFSFRRRPRARHPHTACAIKGVCR